MGINRRNFLKVAGAAGGILLAGGARSARSAQTPQAPRPEEALSSSGSSSTRPSASAAGPARRRATRRVESAQAGSLLLQRERVREETGNDPGRLRRREPVPEREGPGEADLRPEAVHALHRAFLRLGLPLQGDGEDARRTDRLPQGSLHGMPILHDFLPLRHPEVRIRQALRRS